MILAFSNRKGRIGKSSLCMALANYWASNDIPVIVIDVDPQQSLYNTRERDLRIFEDKPKYDVLRFDLSNQLDKLLECIHILKQSDFNILFDTPSGVDSDVFMHVVKLSDYVIVPIQYDTFTIDMTGRYSSSLRLLEEMFPMLHRTVIYVPNKVADIRKYNDNFASKEGHENDVEFFCGGIKTPGIPLHTCVQKINTLFLTTEQMACLTPCFESLTNVMQNHNMLNISNQMNNEGHFGDVLN